MLIDADNTQLSKLEEVLNIVSTYGRIVVKRAYGNWRKDILKNWENEINRLAIQPVQQFDYVSGKNTSDIALVIDAMELLHRNIYDAFVLVSSDSDFTPLALKINEYGKYVIGVGEMKTPEAFKNACGDFVLLENISVKKTNKKTKKSKPSAEKDPLEPIHELIEIAWDNYQDEDGFCNVSAAGTYIKRVRPDFSSVTYGYRKLPELISAFPKRYEVKKYRGSGTVQIIAFRCIDT